MANQMVTIKLNRFTSFLQLPTQAQTQTQSPSDLLTIILFHLNQWLTALSNLFSSLFGPDARAHWPDFSPSEILSRWLADLFPPETRARWLHFATHWLPFVVGGALLLCFLCFCLPLILSCLTWVLVACFNIIRAIFMMMINLIKGFFTMMINLIKGFFTMMINLIKHFFMMLFNGIKSVFRCLCCCGRTSAKMMKAPGRGGRVFIPRADFESNPAAYFQSLRGSTSRRLR